MLKIGERLRLFLFPVFCFLLAVPLHAAPPAPPLQALICVDGVPLGIMKEVMAAGAFPSFRPPAPLISTFPAITEVMLTELYGTEYQPGYGLRYYHRDANALRGGLSSPEAISIWFDLYDYITPIIERGIIYKWARWGDVDIDRTLRLLDRADSGLFLLHLDATDAMLHVNRPEVTRRWLERFSRRIEEFLARRDAEIVIFSDHGNDLTPCRRVDIEGGLKQAGFQSGSTIQGESGVAILPTGLISVSYLYTKRKAEVAEALTRVAGVDFSVHESGGRVFVVSDRGTAAIDRSPDGALFAYRPLSGDPLRLETTVMRLAARGLLSADGLAPNRAWFEETIGHDYPDPLKAAWDGVTGHVVNVADVLVSLKDGWHCGSKMLALLVKFVGTHGSMTRGSITGFAVSNRRALPPLRAGELLDHLDWRDRLVAERQSAKVRFRERAATSAENAR
jgi:hypothetical protein